MPGRTDEVERADDIAVTRVAVATDQHAQVRVFLPARVEGQGELVVPHQLVVEIDQAGLVHGHAHRFRAESAVAVVAVGRFTRTPLKFTMLRLTSMNAASRKNMMSISGMISMRASLSGAVWSRV
jgi:hypothetical protein